MAEPDAAGEGKRASARCKNFGQLINHMRGILASANPIHGVCWKAEQQDQSDKAHSIWFRDSILFLKIRQPS